jgi:hypothetical protein
MGHGCFRRRQDQYRGWGLNATTLEPLHALRNHTTQRRKASWSGCAGCRNIDVKEEMRPIIHTRHRDNHPTAIQHSFYRIVLFIFTQANVSLHSSLASTSRRVRSHTQTTLTAHAHRQANYPPPTPAGRTKPDAFYLPYATNVQISLVY